MKLCHTADVVDPESGLVHALCTDLCAPERWTLYLLCRLTASLTSPATYSTTCAWLQLERRWFGDHGVPGLREVEVDDPVVLPEVVQQLVEAARRELASGRKGSLFKISERLKG